MKREERELEWIVCCYDHKGSWLQGSSFLNSYEDLATIQMLRNDVQRQLKELEKGIHADGFLIPWGYDGKVLITQDGAYIWDEELLDYKQVLIEAVYQKDLAIKRYRGRILAMVVYD